MRPSLLSDTLKSLIEAGRTVCVEGPPGGGKTSIIRQVAEQLDRHYVEVHLPTMLVEDFGVPMLNSDTLRYVLPEWYPAKGSHYDDGRGGVLCFDDSNQASADLQKVLANIAQARNLHGVPLADNWCVIRTGNRQQDRAGANRVLSHLRNRETVITLETNVEDSTEWMSRNGVHPLGIAFINFRKDLLHAFDPQRDVNPTPRSWVEGVFNLMERIPSGSELEVFGGAVGEGAAAEFSGFLKVWRKLPTLASIISNPTGVAIPTDPATLYATAGMIASSSDRGNFDKLMTYILRLPAEFNVLCVNMATRRDPSLVSTSAFSKWSLNPATQKVL